LWSITYDRPGLQLLAYRPVHDAVLARLGDVEPSLVVDLGCGTGQLTQRLRHRFPGATIVGVDLSEGMLSEAADRNAEIGHGIDAFVRADAHRLPFVPASVDVVVCTESFHWYRDQTRVLDGVADVLRPGGRLLIASIATVTDLGDRLLRRTSGSGDRGVRAVPPHRMRSLLSRSGFEMLHQRRVPRLGPVAWPVLTDARRP
jgi:ubiquinone/menaquinone biosynthesis C-methylase UbiE